MRTVVHLGPFAEHTIRLVKSSSLSSTMALYVDDEILAECQSADIGGASDAWQCKFNFIGERCLDFHVFEETQNGVQLETKSLVTVPHSYTHSVEVVYHHKAIDHLADAVLLIDGVDVVELEHQVAIHNEPTLSATREVLACQYGIEIPKKVLPQDTRGTVRKLAGHVAGNVWKDLEVNRGPLNEVAAQKAGELGAMVSQLSTDAYAFYNSLQRAAWSCAPAEASNAIDQAHESISL